MNIVAQLVIIAFLVEAVWETLKMTWQEGKLSKDRLGALAVGLVIAFTMNVDLFTTIGLNPILPYVGVIATGILTSRGANYLNDLISLINRDK